MCQRVIVAGKAGKHLTNCYQLAEFLNIKPDELSFVGGEAMPEIEGADWRAGCLCPIDIDASLDRAAVWHRRDDHGDTLAWQPIAAPT